MDNRNVRALGQLWCRLLFENQHSLFRTFDAVYLHGLSEGMIASCKLFDTVVHEVVLGRAHAVSFNGSDGRGMPPQDRPGATWPGSGWYREELLARDIRSEMFMPTRTGLHTRDECDALIELAAEQGWRNLAIVTVPYHWPRVLACLVAAMRGKDYCTAVYFLRPRTPIWSHAMEGSQGVLKDSTFINEAGDDVFRLFKYWDKGREGDAWRTAWGAPPEEIFRYLDWRDSLQK